MIAPYLAISLITSAALLASGVIVVVRNPRAYLNRLFLGLVAALAAWMITNYFSNDQSLSASAALLANHFVLFFAGIGMTLALCFVAVIGKSRFLLAHISIVSYVHAAVIVMTLTPLVVDGISRQNDVHAISFGPLAIVYFGLLLIDVILIFYALILGILKGRGVDKGRATIILLTLGTWLLINIITNALLPVLFGLFALTNIGPLSSVLVAAGFAYSIARYKLFNIQAVIARSVGYAFSVLTLIVLYALIAFFILDSYILSNENLSSKTVFAFTVTAMVIAFSLQPIKRFFDKISRRIFYQDGYDPQGFLDAFNRNLVSTLDVETLLGLSSRSIADVFRADSCTFAIRHSAKGSFELTSTVKHPEIPNTIFAMLSTEMRSSVELPIITDSLEDASRLRTVLYANNIAVICSLKSQDSSPLIGYLLLGFKRSGNLYTDDDIKLLGIVASELGLAIENALRFEEIENFNATLQQKVDEATHKLRRTNDKLRMLDETKDDFISMASHQLRTPLTSVKGYVSMVLDGDAGRITPLQRKLLNQSFISAQRMVYLISDLLNVSRLRTGKFIIEPAPCNLATIINEEVEQLIETAKGRNLTLSYNRPEHFPDLMLDETKIRQVIMNFIDNAIYYTPAGGHIAVALTNKPDSVEFTVTDDGIGVPRAEQHHLFSKFYRAPNAKRARPDGTGLGLFMAKKVIIAQGGATLFRSKEGEGSTFGFTFQKQGVLASSPEVPSLAKP